MIFFARSSEWSAIKEVESKFSVGLKYSGRFKRNESLSACTDHHFDIEIPKTD